MQHPIGRIEVKQSLTPGRARKLRPLTPGRARKLRQVGAGCWISCHEAIPDRASHPSELRREYFLEAILMPNKEGRSVGKFAAGNFFKVLHTEAKVLGRQDT